MFETSPYTKAANPNPSTAVDVQLLAWHAGYEMLLQLHSTENFVFDAAKDVYIGKGWLKSSKCGRLC